MIFEEAFWRVWHTTKWISPVQTSRLLTWPWLPICIWNSMILTDDCVGQKKTIVNTCTQLLSLKLEFKLKSNFSFLGKNISPDVLIYKDQVQKMSDSSGHSWRTSLRLLYNAIHYSQNWTVAALISSVWCRKVPNYSFPDPLTHHACQMLPSVHMA